ncbi:isoprenoid synthase domain-containing protein [Flagelloscypha sp. PMI_526]|nr:isoprenoid synthase domain-containing protein [Flagelloscypha sp. PMI_526]
MLRRAPLRRITTNALSSPHAHLKPHLAHVRQTLLTLLTAASPALTEGAQYYFLQPSKLLRPLLVLLFSQATNGVGKAWEKKRSFWDTLQISETYPDEDTLQYVVKGERFLDRSLTQRPSVLNDWNPILDPHKHGMFDPDYWDELPQPIPPSAKSLSSPPQNGPPRIEQLPHVVNEILPTQMRLAEILELIHAASLLHDDVIDAAPLRRGVPSAPWAFQPGAKMSVMTGTFILGRASALLSRLDDPNAIELVASIVRCLVEGEVLQMGVGAEVDVGAVDQRRQDAWNIYLQKTYMKTASLMAKGCRAAVSLGGCVDGQDVWPEIAYAYGRNLGISFQLVDDVLDFTQAPAVSPSPTSTETNTLGKPTNADLTLGLATGPALYASETHPQLSALIERRFNEPGDVELARNLILDSDALDRTKKLAKEYADQALRVIEPLPPSEGKRGLEGLVESVVKRVN